MKHPFDLDDFESFLSEHADKHRMYASDRVWRNIQEKLHGIDKWPALTFASILTIAIIAVTLTITYPNKNLIAPESEYAMLGMETIPDVANNIIENPRTIAVAPDVPKEIIPTASALNVAINNKKEQGLIGGKQELALQVAALSFEAEEHMDTDIDKTTIQSHEEVAVGALGVEVENNFENPKQTAGQIQVVISAPEVKINPSANDRVVMVQSHIIDQEKHEIKETIKQEVFKNATLAYGPIKNQPLSASKSKLALQLYATPSISYRYLLEDKNFTDDGNSGPIAPHLTNSVNEFVRHQPKMGLEVGGALLYKLSDNFRLKTGLQFNYRQFGISAYTMSHPEPAMLALNRANGIDSVISYTNINAQSGVKPLDLTSNFLQVAIPLGFDLKMGELKNVEFFVSAAGQFTYDIASSSYIISSDFKNYISKPAELDRKFNINTAIEAFASFEMGGVTWQAGPQIRYQMLPGSKNAYAIREHLIDYGLKIGVVKRIK